MNKQSSSSFAEFFEKLSVQFGKTLPFVAYRKPGESSVKAIFQTDDQLHRLKNFSESGFLMAPFETSSIKIILKPDAMLECSEQIGQNSEVVNGIMSQRSGEEPSAVTKSTYLHLVARAIEEIKQGTFEKVVLSRYLDVPTKFAPLELYKRLLNNYQNAFCYLWYHPKVGIWMGATPEILLRLHHGQLTTISLAGTQKFDGTENPQWGQKEQQEQELVTDYIVHTLQKKGIETERTPAETVRAGDILHLRTKISGRIETENLDTVVEALHPTPAVCGLPKDSALNFILNQENYDREFYTGFLGELNMGTERQRNANRKNQENQVYRSVTKTTTLFVNLRCMGLTENKARIFVGGGITKDSDPQREWEETVAKSATMLNILK